MKIEKKNKITTNPFVVAYDSDYELKGWEYTIPEGMEAIIQDGKVIVRQKENDYERIRKWFEEFILSCVWRKDFTLTKQEVLTWLINQKESTKLSIDDVKRIINIHREVLAEHPDRIMGSEENYKDTLMRFIENNKN